ncbi:MAG TPA: methyltransferase domain-containing protein [Terriglobales bacterium]
MVVDPVAAYDRLAPYYSHFSKRRVAYLRSIEEQIAARIPAGAKSLLDIGAGDGSRAVRIAGAAAISRIVLLEPSARMSGQTPAGCEVWRSRAEDLDASAIAERFDVITCLWNVLGHVPGFERRVRALSAAAQLLCRDGLMFVDVIHRYNVRSYGATMTAVRWLQDRIAPSDSNGDVRARWSTANGEITTYGHVFADREMRRLADAAGLRFAQRIAIDYETGQIRHASWTGNLLYVFRRAS